MEDNPTAVRAPEDAQAITTYPVAPAVGSILAEWQAEGLVPREITPEDLVQRLTITHNSGTGQFEWHTERMDGVQALGLLADVAFDLYQYFFQLPLRPHLNSGQGKVCIQLDGDTLSMAFQPERDPLVAKGMLLAALFGLCERVQSGGFDPADALFGRLQWPVGEK